MVLHVYEVHEAFCDEGALAGDGLHEEDLVVLAADVGDEEVRGGRDEVGLVGAVGVCFQLFEDACEEVARGVCAEGGGEVEDADLLCDLGGGVGEDAGHGEEVEVGFHREQEGSEAADGLFEAEGRRRGGRGAGDTGFVLDRDGHLCMHEGSSHGWKPDAFNI